MPLGLRWVATAASARAGLAGVTAAQAPTLREAARTLIRFRTAVRPQLPRPVGLRRGRWRRLAELLLDQPCNAFNRFVVDSVLSSWHHQLGALLGGTLALERVKSISRAGLCRAL